MAQKKIQKNDVGLTNRYLNPLTDYGFKRLFGREEIMKAFLNDLLQLPSPIDRITFLDKEMDPVIRSLRGVVYDLRCTTKDGSEFIVEMQNKSQKFFSDRILYYLSRSLSTQKESGESEWDFKLEPVYGIFFLNFHMEGVKPAPLRTIRLKVDETGEVFSDKMRAFTLELPEFRNKPEDFPKDKIEYWLYNLANMETMTSTLPFQDKQPVFGMMGTLAELAKMSKAEITKYFTSLDEYRTTRATLSYEREQGLNEGLIKGRAEGERQKAMSIAQALKSSGMSQSQIAQITGLSVEEIGKL